MKEIYLALVHARDRLNRPIALRYTLGLDNDHSFDIKKLTRKIKSLFEDTGYSFIYSFEYAERQKGLHLEMILVVDQTIYNPIQIFNLLRKLFFNLDGVTINIESEYKKVSFNFHERKEEYLSVIGGSKVGHNLKDEAQFKDCIYRASYLAKQNDKALVQYKKTFGTVTG
ncbi:inovirus-type Gp2 protein [Acinetobacter geminorum]|uniref:Inovirus-type Gp2 protein n=1 Tax=Acinetobacter geminorum TaxID=2730922 RepID=A0ABT8ZFM6_9GAMM|nr:inovirus-type Gp2 protein [Acinetobacter geminorum]MDO7363507.1 inovirus-type Gp2 protein [Acinetobacter geminorum]